MTADNADNKWRVRALTPEEVRAQADDLTARMAQLEELWERSGRTDVRALRGALVFLETQLPPWVHAGLMAHLKVEEMQRPFHGVRWLLVREARDRGLVSGAEYEDASKRSQGTSAQCRPDMMMKSFQLIERAIGALRSARSSL
jgi:hypothetical protein